MRKLLFIAGIAVIFSMPIAYAGPPDMGANIPYAGMSQSSVPYLGVAIDSLPPAVASQIPPGVSGGEGVLVTSVAPDSPAAKAGIQQYDILVSYGDQKLFSPEQLTKLVRSDQVGREVIIKLIREGKVSDVKVVLGGRPARLSQEHDMPYQGRRHPWFAPPWSDPQWQSSPRPQRFIESFESLSINKTADGQYKVVVDYLAEDGVKKHHEFQGTRDEINDLIRQEKDLPSRLKQQLLQALNNRGRMLMPPEFMAPFDRPFFNRFMEGWPGRF